MTTSMASRRSRQFGIPGLLDSGSSLTTGKFLLLSANPAQQPISYRSALGIAKDILFHNSAMKRHVLIFGLVGGFVIAVLQYTEYRFVIIEHSVELYGALVAVLFATFGIWLGLRLIETAGPGNALVHSRTDDDFAYWSKAKDRELGRQYQPGVRFAAWDGAGNGALTQPVKLRSNN